MPAASTPRPRHTSPASRHADRASAPEDPGNPEQSRNRCPTSREEEAVVFLCFLSERRVVNAVSAVSAFLRFRCGVVNAVSAVSAFQSLPLTSPSLLREIEGVTKKEPSNRGLLSLWIFTNNVVLFLVPSELITALTQSSLPESCGHSSCSGAVPCAEPRRRVPRPRWDKPS